MYMNKQFDEISQFVICDSLGLKYQWNEVKSNSIDRMNENEILHISMLIFGCLLVKNVLD